MYTTKQVTKEELKIGDRVVSGAWDGTAMVVSEIKPYGVFSDKVSSKDDFEIHNSVPGKYDLITGLDEDASLDISQETIDNMWAEICRLNKLVWELT